MIDYEDVKRILDQLYADDSELFDRWMDEYYCINCVNYDAKVLEAKE
jgi:hypothetical protein